MFPSTYLDPEFYGRRTIVGRLADGRQTVVGGAEKKII